MRDGVVHTVGYLNNRQDPIKLGQVTEQDPTVSFLKVAQNIDIDDRGVATTRDGQVERYLGAASSLWVHPQDDKVAFFVELVSELTNLVTSNWGFYTPSGTGWIVTDGVVSINDSTAVDPVSVYQADNVVEAGIDYTVSFDVTGFTGNNQINCFCGGITIANITANGSYELSFTSFNGTELYFGLLLNPAVEPVTGTISNILLYEPSSVVEDSILKQLNTDFTATTIATMNSDNDISYELINGTVFLSNGVDIGYIENGAFVPFSQTLLRDELPMPAGEYIAYLDNEGVLLVASGSVVYRSKPWNPQVRDARFSEFPMNGKVRMLATVEDGWFVATEKNVSFAQMDDADGYSFRHITDSVPPDGAFYKEFHFDEDKGRDSQMRVIWASPDGFIEGTSGGGYENHSYPNVALPTGNKGKVFNRNANGTNQYLAVISNPEDDDNYVAPTLLKNRITP